MPVTPGSYRYSPIAISPVCPRRRVIRFFSVYQTDIVYYGRTLADYFSAEFRLCLPKELRPPEEITKIPFWGRWVEEGFDGVVD